MGDAERTRHGAGGCLRAVAAAVGVVLLTSSCGVFTSDADIQVAVVWGGDELDQFRAIVDVYEEDTGLTVQLVAAGDDMDSFLRAQHRSGDLPDVAMLSQPGLVADYAASGWLEPLDDLVEVEVVDPVDGPEPAPRYAAFWKDLGTAVDETREETGDEHFYGAWVKAAYKSAFWCLPDPDRWLDDRQNRCDIAGSQPETWDELVSRVRKLAGDEQSPAPLAVGAADGWVLTDWLEAVLAVEADEDLYDALASGEALWDDSDAEAALHQLADVWGIEGALPASSGADRALLTQFDESVIQVAETDEATLVFGADFAQRIAADFRPDDVDAWSLLPFPLFSPDGVESLVVGGDAAVVFEGSEHGADLVDWLTDPADHADRFEDWLLAGGYMSPVEGTYGTNFCPELGTDPDCDLSLWIGTQVANRIIEVDEGDGSTSLRFDLSNQLSIACSGRIEAVLQDFFVDVGEQRTDRQVGRLVGSTADALNEAVEGASC